MKKVILLVTAFVLVCASPASAWTFNVETKSVCEDGKTRHSIIVRNPEKTDAQVFITTPSSEVVELKAPAKSAAMLSEFEAGTYTVKVIWPEDKKQPTKTVTVTDLTDCVPETTTTVAPTTTEPPQVAGTVVERGPEHQQLAVTGFGDVVLWIIGGVLLIVVGKKLVRIARER